jgi:glycogen debranching enzyme
MISYKLDQTPFSRSGTFLLITSRNSSGSPRLLYKTSSGRVHNTHNIPFPADEFFELALIKGTDEVPYKWQAFPHMLELSGESGEHVTFVFGDTSTILFKAENVGLRLMPSKVFPNQYSPSPNQVYLNDWYARGIHMFLVEENGTLEAKVAPIVTGIEKHWGEYPCTISFNPKPGHTVFEGAIRFSHFEDLWVKPPRPVALVEQLNREEYDLWQSKLPRVGQEYQEAAELAWFLLWSCQVPVDGPLTRPSIYMSKFWMNGVWAWDNLFNSIAVIDADSELAWNQLLVFFDHQDQNGMVPDMISDLEPIYGFTKPPIHGWALPRLIAHHGMDASLPFLRQLYDPLCRLTNWWYSFRDFDHDGMPQYFHGNDSGWDNSTIFDQSFPVEGADLAAYLVLQCEELASIARTLGKDADADRWRARADQQLTDLLKHSIVNNHFISPLSGSHASNPSKSLINYMPLILGRRLPEQIRSALINDLKPGGPYLTQFGLASEPPTSVKYMPDGYWRGPIWAASTYLIFDGLLQVEENQLASLIARRFCDLCIQQPGFWENYDALTGKGLRCPGYSWTASVFILLAEWLAKNGAEKDT